MEALAHYSLEKNIIHKIEIYMIKCLHIDGKKKRKAYWWEDSNTRMAVW